MANTNNRFFTASNSEANLLKKRNDMVANFEIGDKNYYQVKFEIFVSLSGLEDNEGDYEEVETKNGEDIEAKKKMSEISKMLLNNGCVEITSKEYKFAEKTCKENKQKSFLDIFSKEEKFVYYKTKEFINTYDFESSQQKSFLTSLRNLILSKNEITLYALDEHAQKTKKELDDIFDAGQQEMVADFAANLQMITKLEFSNKNKLKV